MAAAGVVSARPLQMLAIFPSILSLVQCLRCPALLRSRMRLDQQQFFKTQFPPWRLKSLVHLTCWTSLILYLEMIPCLAQFDLVWLAPLHVGCILMGALKPSAATPRSFPRLFSLSARQFDMWHRGIFSLVLPFLKTLSCLLIETVETQCDHPAHRV